jgi:hypothetical protein
MDRRLGEGGSLIVELAAANQLIGGDEIKLSANRLGCTNIFFSNKRYRYIFHLATL